MKKHLSNHSEVLHFWANEKQDTGYCGNIEFENKTIYSYGHHFPMARHIPGDYVLITTRKDSVTTAGHLSGCLSAIPAHKTVIYCDYVFPLGYYSNDEDLFFPMESHISNLQIMCTELEEIKLRFKHARIYKEHYLNDYSRKLDNMILYTTVFKIKSKIPYAIKQVIKAGPIVKDEKYFKWEKRKKELDIINQKKEVERQRQYAIDNKERLEREKVILDKKIKEFPGNLIKWRKCESNNGQLLNGFNYDFSFPERNETYLRVNKELNLIETSKYANITIKQAIKLWPYILKSFEEESTITLPGIELSGYRINDIKSGDLSIGCHNIKYIELYYIANELKLIKHSFIKTIIQKILNFF